MSAPTPTPEPDPALTAVCPACGSIGEFYTGHTGGNNAGKWMVSCAAQDANFHGTPGVSDDWCPAEHGSETAWFASRQEAADEWNRIATTPTPEP